MTATTIRWGWAVALLLAAVLTGCSAANPDPGPQETGGTATTPPPEPPSTRRLAVVVTGTDGSRLDSATVSVVDNRNRAVFAVATTGVEGTAQFDGVPGSVSVNVSHPVGTYRSGGLVIAQGTQMEHFARVLVGGQPLAVAVLPGTIAQEHISPDRTSLELDLTLVASASTPFQPSSYGGRDTTPYVRLGNCFGWLDDGERQPRCRYDAGGRVSLLDLAFQDVGTRVGAAPNPGHTAMLLHEVGSRARSYEPDSVNIPAIRQFVGSVNAGSRTGTPGKVAAAAITDVEGTAETWWPLLYLPPPAWQRSDPAGAFRVDAATQRATVATLGQATLTRPTPVFDALRATYGLLATHAPAGSRELVAVLAGGDGAALTQEQRRDALGTLAMAQAAAGVRSIIVAFQPGDDSPERANLAELAEALRAPLIMAGYPASWSPGFVINRSGTYSAMELAAELATGSAVPSMTMTFRMQSEPGTSFVSGSLLHGTLYVESDVCPMGCAELPLPFAVRVP